jgi:hypothetical protein
MDPHIVTERVQAAAATIAVARLVYVGLAKRFPAMLAYLVLDALSSFAYGVLSPRSLAYFWIYVSEISLECILTILAVRELVNLIFTNFPGIRTVGRWAIYAGIGLAIFISIVTILWSNSYHRKRWALFYLESTQRSVFFSLVFVIMAILFVLSKYPLHLGRNTYVSSAFFSAIFLSEAARLFLDTLAPWFFNHLVDWTEAVFTALCLGAWALMLQRQSVPVARVAFSTSQEDQLLAQLNSLNQLMTRAARR